MGAKFFAGPPQEKFAPSGGRELHEAGNVEAKFFAGLPQEKFAPLGGSVHTKWESVGAISLSADIAHFNAPGALGGVWRRQAAQF